MIKDKVVLGKLRSEWKGVQETRDLIARNLAASSFGIGSIGPSHQFRNFAYNLCLLFAFSVLEHCLLQLPTRRCAIAFLFSRPLSTLAKSCQNRAFLLEDMHRPAPRLNARDKEAERLIIAGKPLRFLGHTRMASTANIA